MMVIANQDSQKPRVDDLTKRVIEIIFFVFKKGG